MQLPSLKYFAAVARSGSLRHAAEVFDIAPSAISRQIALLESRLAVTLFERSSRGMTLTEAGKVLLDFVDDGERRVGALSQRLDDLSALRRGTVRLAVVEATAHDFLPRILERFSRLHPGIEFRVSVCATGEIPDSVDWASLAKGAPVIVLYMALKHIERIAERLIAGGRLASEPVAVIAKATTAEQRVIETTLSRAAIDVAEAGIEPPAMVVVGEVVRLRAAMDWLGALDGKRLVSDPLGQRQRDRTG